MKNIESAVKTTYKIFIAGAISFVFLEQAVRFVLFGFDSFNYFKVNSFNTLGHSGLIKPSPYLEIGYELKPNLNTYYKITRFKTNSQGLRDKEYAIAKPQNTFRIAVLGDSFVMASGITIEDAFHTVLEDRLNAESPGISYEVINFGVAGYDPRQYLMVIKYKVLEYKPDIVLFCLSKPFEIFYEGKRFKKTYKVKSKTYPFFQSFFLKMAKRNAIIYCISKKYLVNGKKNKSKNMSRLERIQKTEDVFSELSRIGKIEKIPICIIVLRHYYGRQADINRLKKLASKYDLYAIDTSSAFKNTVRSAYHIYKLDAHPNAKANEIFARVIHSYLKAHKLLGNNL